MIWQFDHKMSQADMADISSSLFITLKGKLSRMLHMLADLIVEIKNSVFMFLHPTCETELTIHVLQFAIF